ncbi:alpha/beta hydrolase [Nonomuraea basaltis]|uniref:alpha/beta hydrolase n=1 Tax=Nonomuraea basaltis TaxID=2495887 RepID=UPI0014868E4A|nr:alpha/beta hydrolase [Nonomuraea basaltis]
MTRRLPRNPALSRASKDRKRLATALIACALTLTSAVMAAAPAAAESRTSEPRSSKIRWTACKDTNDKNVECATIKVPLDYSRPRGQTIDIALARRKATKPGSRIGSILLDPGGPGVPGTFDVKIREHVFTEAVSERFDVIGFDPRGVGDSTQVKCDSKLVQKVATARSLAGRSQADFSALRRANEKLSQNCRKLTGPLYDHVDNLHVVRDIDAIRVALGEKKITQVGYSYGTMMGQQYAAMFPQHVRATVNDANVDHSATSLWDFVADETAAMENNFVQFADWCDETSDCALYGKDTRKIYAELRKRAKNGTLRGLDGKPMDSVKLNEMATGVNLPEFWKVVATRFKNLHDGTVSSGSPTPPPAPKTPAVVNHSRQAMYCQDWNFRVKNYAEFKSNLARLARKFPIVEWNANATEGVLDCVGYKGKTTNPQVPLTVKGAPPLVMIGTVNDFMAVYPWSQNAAKQSGSTLVTYEGFGHTIYPKTAAFGPSKCINDLIDDYLINLKVPAKGTRCPGIEVPGEGNPPGPRQPTD